MRHLRTIPLMAAATVAALASAVMPDRTLAAETTAPPAHLTAYNLDWLNYIAPEDLPPTRYAVCIVDSGVAITPDTPPDDPAGPILRRLATDGGSGEPQGTAEEQLHGTRMAMSAIAPMNDWGTIGTWTGGRVVSVRAMVEGETTFRAEAYRRGIDQCLQVATYRPVAVINLSMGCGNCTFSSGELALLEERLSRAHKAGVTVVASAGNRQGHRSDMPAAHPSVLSVAAGTASGQLCDYASFDDKVAAIGPGCPIDTAEPLTGHPVSTMSGGSSVAALTLSSLLSALRTLRPDATRTQAEDWVVTGSRMVRDRRVLDGDLAAQAAGLEGVMQRARSRVPRPEAPATPADGVPVVESAPAEASNHASPGRSNPVSRQLVRRLPTPQGVRASWRRNQLVVRAVNRRARARLQVTTLYRTDEFLVRRGSSRAISRGYLRLALRRRPSMVQLRWLPRVDRDSHWTPSRTRTVPVRAVR